MRSSFILSVAVAMLTAGAVDVNAVISSSISISTSTSVEMVTTQTISFTPGPTGTPSSQSTCILYVSAISGEPVPTISTFTSKFFEPSGTASVVTSTSVAHTITVTQSTSSASPVSVSTSTSFASQATTTDRVVTSTSSFFNQATTVSVHEFTSIIATIYTTAPGAVVTVYPVPYVPPFDLPYCNTTGIFGTSTVSTTRSTVIPATTSLATNTSGNNVLGENGGAKQNGSTSVENGGMSAMLAMIIAGIFTAASMF